MTFPGIAKSCIGRLIPSLTLIQRSDIEYYLENIYSAADNLFFQYRILDIEAPDLTANIWKFSTVIGRCSPVGFIIAISA